MFKRILYPIVAILVIGMMLFVNLPTASAHHNTVVVNGTCQPDGTRLITVAVTNSESDKTETVTAINQTLTGIVVGTVIPKSGTATGTKIIPGTAGTFSVTVSGRWSNGVTHTDSGSKTFSQSCPQPPPFSVVSITANCDGSGQVTFTGTIPSGGIILTLMDKHNGSSGPFIPSDPLIQVTIPVGATSPTPYQFDLSGWTGGPHYRVDSNFSTKSPSLSCTPPPPPVCTYTSAEVFMGWSGWVDNGDGTRTRTGTYNTYDATDTDYLCGSRQVTETETLTQYCVNGETVSLWPSEAGDLTPGACVPPPVCTYTSAEVFMGWSGWVDNGDGTRTRTGTYNTYDATDTDYLCGSRQVTETETLTQYCVNGETVSLWPSEAGDLTPGACPPPGTVVVDPEGSCIHENGISNWTFNFVINNAIVSFPGTEFPDITETGAFEVVAGDDLHFIWEATGGFTGSGEGTLVRSGECVPYTPPVPVPTCPYDGPCTGTEYVEFGSDGTNVVANGYADMRCRIIDGCLFGPHRLLFVNINGDYAGANVIYYNFGFKVKVPMMLVGSYYTAEIPWRAPGYWHIELQDGSTLDLPIVQTWSCCFNPINGIDVVDGTLTIRGGICTEGIANQIVRDFPEWTFTEAYHWVVTHLREPLQIGDSTAWPPTK